MFPMVFQYALPMRIVKNRDFLYYATAISTKYFSRMAIRIELEYTKCNYYMNAHVRFYITFNHCKIQKKKTKIIQ